MKGGRRAVALIGLTAAALSLAGAGAFLQEANPPVRSAAGSTTPASMEATNVRTAGVTPAIAASPPTLEPTALATVSPMVGGSQTIDLTKWWNRIPDSPYQKASDVPLARDSSGFLTPGAIQPGAPGRGGAVLMKIGPGTILQVDPDPVDGTMRVTLGLNPSGTTVARTHCGSRYVPSTGRSAYLCDYRVPAVRVEIDDQVTVQSPAGIVGYGLRSAASYMSVGSQMSVYAQAPGSTASATPQMPAVNLKSLNAVKSSVGKKGSWDKPSSFYSFWINVFRLGPVPVSAGYAAWTLPQFMFYPASNTPQPPLTLPITSITRPSDSSALDSGWESVAPEGAGFTTRMPGPPLTRTQQIDVSKSKGTATLYVYEASPDLGYFVIAAKYPPGSLRSVTQTAIYTGVLKGIAGVYSDLKVTEEGQVLGGAGYGRSFTIAGDGGYLRGYLVLKGDMLYVVYAAFGDSTAGLLDVDVFLADFSTTA
jgi:hypothetical protein